MLATNEIMRKNNNKGNVRTITTGHIEGDMLGQVFLWLSERQNSKYAQRPHRTYKRTRKLNISESYIRVWFRSYIRVWFRAAIEWSQTAPTALLRKFQAWQNKKDASTPKYLSGLRKDKRNGN